MREGRGAGDGGDGAGVGSRGGCSERGRRDGGWWVCHGLYGGGSRDVGI